MPRRTNSEGALPALSRREELIDLREQQKALLRDLTEAKLNVKALRAKLEDVTDKLGFCIDNIDQPNLPFLDASGAN